MFARRSQAGVKTLPQVELRRDVVIVHVADTHVRVVGKWMASRNRPPRCMVKRRASGLGTIVVMSAWSVMPWQKKVSANGAA
jgi:hypothetical protein